MSNSYRVFVSASDKYIWALQPFAYLFNKYWSPEQQVVIIGFSPPPFPLPDNFQFASMGNQADYPWEKWTNAIIKFLNGVDDDVFVFMLEDYWITRQVDTRAVQILVDYCRQFEYVAKMDLITDRLYAYGADLNYNRVAYLDLVKSSPESQYHFSLMGGIWRRTHMLRNMVLNESPHDCELNGTPRLAHDQDVIVLGTRQCPLRHTLAFRARDPGHLNLSELASSDIEEMRKLGYLRQWGIV